MRGEAFLINPDEPLETCNVLMNAISFGNVNRTGWRGDVGGRGRTFGISACGTDRLFAATSLAIDAMHMAHLRGFEGVRFETPR